MKRWIVTLIAAGLAGCAASGQARQGTVEITPEVKAVVNAAVEATAVKMEAVVKTEIVKNSTSVNDPWTFRILAVGALVTAAGYWMGKGVLAGGRTVFQRLAGSRDANS